VRFLAADAHPHLWLTFNLIPTWVGTVLVEGKERRTIDGRDYALEYPIRGDVGLIKAHRADTAGSLVDHKTARNFGPVMAAAGYGASK
jgi:3-oxoadipate CoA-transferase alpha subunit